MRVRRFIRFNAVGALGVGVRLAVAATLVDGFGLHYLVATAVAIEVAVLHNFFWHLRWTWAEREGQTGAVFDHVLFRCLAFHASNGLVSTLGSMALMPMLVGGFHIHYLVANVVAVGCTGLMNFFIGDRLVFRRD